MDIGTMIVGALAGGGAAVARMEIARFTHAAIQRLSRRGRSARELGLIMDAMARSDEEMSKELDKFSQDEWKAAAEQINEATVQDDNLTEDSVSDSKLRTLAEEVSAALNRESSSLSVRVNNGQVIQNTGTGPVHAPFRVDGNYDTRTS